MSQNDPPEMQQKICMLDIETLDTTPYARILSLGAVAVYGEEDFYVEFDHSSQYERTVSESTREWWKQQRTMPNGKMDLRQGLVEFSEWYAAEGFTEVWCKGSDFDFPILTDAYKKFAMQPPWEYNTVRDLRTLMKMFPQCKIAFKNRVPHHALADAVHQAYQLQEIFKYVRGLIQTSPIGS